MGKGLQSRFIIQEGEIVQIEIFRRGRLFSRRGPDVHHRRGEDPHNDGGHLHDTRDSDGRDL